MMKIESYKQVKDLVIGDKVLTSSEEYPEATIKALKVSETPGNVMILFDDDFAADVPEDGYVLMPNTMKMYILQPSRVSG